jgi:hypothetical protein
MDPGLKLATLVKVTNKLFKMPSHMATTTSTSIHKVQLMGTDQQQDITILMKFLCQDKTKTSHSI